MTAPEKLYKLLQTLPESQINEVLHFAEFLQQKREHLNLASKGHLYVLLPLP